MSVRKTEYWDQKRHPVHSKFLMIAYAKKKPLLAYFLSASTHEWDNLIYLGSNLDSPNVIKPKKL